MSNICIFWLLPAVTGGGCSSTTSVTSSFSSLFLFSWIEVDKILDVRDEDVTEVVDEHPPPVTAGKSQKVRILNIK